MAWTTADLDALDEAIATGATEVRFSDGRTVRYRDLSEMMRIRRLMVNELGLPTKPRRVYPVFDRGFE